ncbi:putative C6 transcription factor [Xylariaceae sp. AK1471]|nr:putative C6 transcription factor [Xylariaceae sp. AK1471]
MTGRQLIPIQPKPSGVTSAPGWNEHDPDPQPSRPRRSRAAILVACDPCRRLKSKCDGERPACRRCTNKSQECTYELPQDALSRSSARKEIVTQLQRENMELRQLFHDLSKRPEAEAYDIFQRLRSVDDPIALAHSIRQAELLLPHPASQDHGEFTTLQQLNFNALEKSLIKIPAQPWTNVAGDGIVSELISAWFKWDNAFLYAFVDRECFVQDLRAADPKSATYCSPFLVNAICALRSYFSDTVDTARHITKQDLREQFFAEAKKQYDRGVPTLPTIQGLWIMFAIASLRGEDRNGSLYRFASYGMLKKTRVKQSFSALSDTDPDDVSQKRAISKTAWGLFCLESITAINYRNIVIIPPPKIPCLFPEFSYETSINVDLFGQPFAASSIQPPFVIGAVNTFCRVAVLMSEVMTYTNGHKDHEETGSPGEEDDVRKTNEFYAQLNEIDDSLPSALRHDHNLTPQTCFLRVTMNTVAYAILRPLHPDLVFDANDSTSVKATILKHCALDTELMERYFGTWTTEEFSPMAFVGPLNSGTALLPLLPDERAQRIFPRICRLMHTVSARMPIARYVLKGWQAALWARKLDIPAPAQPYFQNLGDENDELTDVSTNLVVAHVPNFEEELTDEWDDGELGFLLKKWSMMSVE